MAIPASLVIVVSFHKPLMSRSSLCRFGLPLVPQRGGLFSEENPKLKAGQAHGVAGLCRSVAFLLHCFVCQHMTECGGMWQASRSSCRRCSTSILNGPKAGMQRRSVCITESIVCFLVLFEGPDPRENAHGL